MSQATRITVVGAGHVGMITAQKCAEKELAREIVLIYVLEGRPQGIALDLDQAAAVEGWRAA
jgi:malate dehydrogenase